MGEIRVRDLPDNVVGLLKDRARRHGQSLVSEVRELLTEEAMRPLRETCDRLDRLREQIREESGELPDSTASIRAERDRRG